MLKERLCFRKTICFISYFGRLSTSRKPGRRAEIISPYAKIDLVVLGFNGPLRQYFSLYQAVPQREGEMTEERKQMSKYPTRPVCKPVGPCPTLIQISWTPRQRKFTQHHRTTRPPPCKTRNRLRRYINTTHGNCLSYGEPYRQHQVKNMHILE